MSYLEILKLAAPETIIVVTALVVLAVDLIVGWVYVLAGVLCLPRHPAVAAGSGNPFR